MKDAVATQGHPSTAAKEKVLPPKHDEWTPFTDKRSFDERVWDT